MLSGIDGGRRVPYHLGHFFIAINIPFFIDLKSFKKTAGNILRALRASKRMPGEDRIYTAGEKEHLAWLERRKKGIPLNKKLQEEIIEMSNDLELTTYRFPF
jgi:LDH2 family malate/lactate/ureidoglycolate dehydrogenase